MHSYGCQFLQAEKSFVSSGTCSNINQSSDSIITFLMKVKPTHPCWSPTHSSIADGFGQSKRCSRASGLSSSLHSMKLLASSCEFPFEVFEVYSVFRVIRPTIPRDLPNSARIRSTKPSNPPFSNLHQSIAPELA